MEKHRVLSKVFSPQGKFLRCGNTTQQKISTYTSIPCGSPKQKWLKHLSCLPKKIFLTAWHFHRMHHIRGVLLNTSGDSHYPKNLTARTHARTHAPTFKRVTISSRKVTCPKCSAQDIFIELKLTKYWHCYYSSHIVRGSLNMLHSKGRQHGLRLSKC